MQWCIEHRVLVAVFPPHSTHRLQPLDVSLFSPLATRYSQHLKHWIDTTGGAFTSSQRDFFGLFWPAFAEAFTKHNIESGWAKTGLAPFSPGVVLDQLKAPSSRPSSASSEASSTLSASDWKKMRHLIRTETATVLNEKLLQGYERVAAENAILKHQLAQANEKIAIQKKRAPRGKPLFEQLRAEGGQKAFFASPSKIERAFELQAQKEAEVEAEKARKQELVIERQLNKRLKELEMQDRKTERERKRVERLAVQAAQKAAKEVKKKQKAVSKQLLLEAKQQNKRPYNKKKQTNKLKVVVLTSQAIEEVDVVKSRQTRTGRKIRPPQYLQGYDF
jgi:DDE superfamily endonuclease